jgi:soluble lytic murein transglycosylase-like protein
VFGNIVTLILISVAAAASLQARESVCLKSGFCLEGDSHMISDGILIVRSGSGTLEFPVDQVDRIVALPALPPPSGSDDASKAVSIAYTAYTNAGADSEQLLMRAAINEGLEPDFVRSVAMVESGLRQNSLSAKGAIGLMQLMPGTAGQLGVDPKLADQNAKGGAAFLRQLLLRYKGDSALALAAYNAGPGAVEKFKGVPPYLETHRYIVKVLREYERQQYASKNLRAAAAKPVPAN